MKKQPEITAKTKQALAIAFCNLYMEKPIDKITIKEITESAGYNRCTFYQYFTDVYDLLKFIENDLLDTMKLSWQNDSNTLVYPDLHKLLVLFDDKECYLKAVLGDYGNSHFLRRLKQELPFDSLQESFSQAGNIVPYLVEFHIATSLSLFHVWLKNGKDISTDELFGLIHNLYTKGISYLLE